MFLTQIPEMICQTNPRIPSPIIWHSIYNLGISVNIFFQFTKLTYHIFLIHLVSFGSHTSIVLTSFNVIYYIKKFSNIYTMVMKRNLAGLLQFTSKMYLFCSLSLTSPGVSTKTICAFPSVNIALDLVLVVCIFCEAAQT